MRVETDGGEVIDLGTTETTPTIGIIDYSRRATDDFGVTTVVERGFARRMSLRMAVSFDGVDALQRRLAGLRATPALWVADDRYDWLSVRGFYKDFSIDLGVPPLSYCTLSIEGLTGSEPFTDTGADPAPDGKASTLRLIQPLTVADAMLVSSSVAETDHPAWASGTAYAVGAQVLLASTHRVYENITGVNTEIDPAADVMNWLDVGATNRWAMFDQALGSATSASGSVAVTIAPGVAVNALAVLDVTASTVRVQTTGYDQTKSVAAGGSALFLDLPDASSNITVTTTGTGTVAVGTLLLGRLVALGVTEASPTAGINDYSRKVVDDFGEATVVQRAWAKRMTARALIRSDALDLVANRIAAVRARASLWIGQVGLDSLTIYGFFKDFSIEVGENVSTLSLSVEGLSTAAPLAPLTASTAWPDVTDPAGTKPEDNADVTATALPAVYLAFTGRSAVDVVNDLAGAVDSIASETMRGATWRGESDDVIYMADGTPVRTVVQALGSTVGVHTAYIAFLQQVGGDGSAKFILTANGDGHIVGIEALAGGSTPVDQLSFVASRFLFVDNSGANPINALTYEDGRWKLKSLEVDTLKVNTAMVPIRVVANSVIAGSYTSTTGTADPRTAILTASVPVPTAGWLEITAKLQQGARSNGPWTASVAMNGTDDIYSLVGGGNEQDNVATQASFYCSGPQTASVTLQWAAYTGIDAKERSMFIKFFPFTE